MEYLIILSIILIVAMLFLSFSVFVLYWLEYAWIGVFGTPIFIHLYLRPKKISEEQQYMLRQKFQFYKSLSDKHKVYFHHRLASFIEMYQFISRENFVITKEDETLIGATYVMLTFGMREYLIDSFDKIIIYPEAYYSTQKNEYHKGEFNPAVKAVVFSWEDFLAGYEISNDNLNLGIHEFTHVIHHHSLRNDDASSVTFRKYYEQLHKEVNYPPNRQKLIDSHYFRIYAYTNEYEFIAVVVEHYFETPELFRAEFPQLFENVSRMLNHKAA